MAAASILSVSDKRIMQMLKSFNNKYKILQKPAKGRKEIQSHQEKIQDFQKVAQARLYNMMLANVRT